MFGLIWILTALKLASSPWEIILLCIIFVVAIVIKAVKGDYCKFDQNWRSSIYCIGLGALFSVSSHGSLLTISVMSIIRCIKCTLTFVNIRKRTIVILSAVVGLLSISNAIIPALPVAYIQNIFRSEIYFTNLTQNPFFSSNPLDVTRLEKLHTTFYPTRPTNNIHSMVKDLQNITSNEGIFDVTDISYYGNSPLCIHNIFKTQASYLYYKIGYCAVVMLLLVVVMVAYITIIVKNWQSQRGAGGAEDNSSALAFKVSLMILSQLLCWWALLISNW